MTRLGWPGTRHAVLWGATCVVWLVVLLLSIFTHGWLGAVASGGLAAISAYRVDRAVRGRPDRAMH